MIDRLRLYIRELINKLFYPKPEIDKDGGVAEIRIGKNSWEQPDPKFRPKWTPNIHKKKAGLVFDGKTYLQGKVGENEKI